MKLRCEMQTKPGMHAQYDGFVDVHVHDLAEWDEVFSAAVKKLQRTAFPDYTASMWRMTSFQTIDH